MYVHSCQSKVCLTESGGLDQDMRRQCTEPFSGPFSSSSPPSQPFPDSHSLHLGPISQSGSTHLLTISSVSCLCLVFLWLSKFNQCDFCCGYSTSLFANHVFFLPAWAASFSEHQITVSNSLISSVQQMKSIAEESTDVIRSFKVFSFSLTSSPTWARDEYQEDTFTNRQGQECTFVLLQHCNKA